MTQLTKPAVEDVEKYRPGVTKAFHEWFIVGTRPNQNLDPLTDLL